MKLSTKRSSATGEANPNWLGKRVTYIPQLWSDGQQCLPSDQPTLFCFCFVFVPFHFVCWIHSLLLLSMLPLSVLSTLLLSERSEVNGLVAEQANEWSFRNEIITPSIWSFPGLYLENYVHSDIGNATISVLQGQVIVELIPDEGSQSQPKNITLHQEQKMQVSQVTTGSRERVASHSLKTSHSTRNKKCR